MTEFTPERALEWLHGGDYNPTNPQRHLAALTVLILDMHKRLEELGGLSAELGRRHGERLEKLEANSVDDIDISSFDGAAYWPLAVTLNFADDLGSVHVRSESVKGLHLAAYNDPERVKDVLGDILPAIKTLRKLNSPK